MGTHRPRLDDKGRLILPAKFRNELAEGLVITQGQEHCLTVFPLAEWNRITEAFGQASITAAKELRDYRRIFFGAASQEEPDRQGRITIPPELRLYAGLTRDCAVIGANRHLEIWDDAAWEAYRPEQEQAFAELAEEVLPGGF